jgi:hypothetical protein
VAPVSRFRIYHLRMSDWRARCDELARGAQRDVEDVLELWAERAAIREHEGGQSHDDAERDAFDDVRAELDGALVAGARRGPRRAEDAVEGAVERAPAERRT